MQTTLPHHPTVPMNLVPPPDFAEPPKPPALPEPINPDDIDIPPVDLPGIDDPELQPPNPKDLKLGIDSDAQASMDRFADGPDSTTQGESAGNFDSRGLGLGSSARKLEPLKLEPIEPLDEEVIEAPQLNIPEEEKPVDEAMAEVEPEADEPALDVASINEAFASVRHSLTEFDLAFSGATSRLQLPASSGDGITEDMKRAIIATAENTRRLVERSKSGGLVFS